MRLFFLTLSFLLLSFGATALWTKMADMPGPGRHRGTGIAIGNKGYIGLGHYNGTGTNIMLSDWWEYDPASNTWTQKADYPGNNGNGNYAVLAFGMANKGYLGGGITGGSNFYEFDPAMNTWTLKAPLPDPITDSYGFVINEKAYYVDNGQTFEYDPTTDSWTVKGPAPFGSAFWNASFTINDKAYVQTGNQLWEYKATTDSWLSRASYPGAAGSATVGFNHMGRGYIMTGFNGSLSNVTREVWSYDPNTNSWLQMEDFPGTSRRFASGFSIGNKAYFGIGTNGTNFSDFWSFDLLAETTEIEKTTIKCFPNPASDWMQISWENEGRSEILITDQAGKTVFQTETLSNTLEVQCSDWSKGQYFIRIRSGEKNHYPKTFVVR